jgi:hypothetical protein
MTTGARLRRPTYGSLRESLGISDTIAKDDLRSTGPSKHRKQEEKREKNGALLMQAVTSHNRTVIEIERALLSYEHHVDRGRMQEARAKAIALCKLALVLSHGPSRRYR